ncbi:MAG TPA: tetratricopeptide repeat protein [Verrucomicrobiae bacterium]|nr:tetratricopeptide repeat protein [Verrucomicrobiae bacterium]
MGLLTSRGGDALFAIVWCVWLVMLVLRLVCRSPQVEEGAAYPPDPDFLRAEQTLGFGWRHFVRSAVGGLHVWRVTPDIGEDSRTMALAKIDEGADVSGAGLDDVAMRGLALAGVGRHEEAATVFSLASKRWPGCVELRLMRAIALMEQGQWQEADVELAAASRRAPALTETRLLQGVACYYRGRANYGAAIFEQVVGMRPDWAKGWIGLGSALSFGGRSKDKAIHAAKKARDLAPDDPDAWTCLSWAYRTWKQNAEAERSAREAVAKFGDREMPWRELGSSLAAQGRFEEAEKAYARALEIRPDSPETLLSRAWSLGALQARWADSAEVCRTLVRQWPRFGWGWRKLALACDELSNWEESASAYREALRVESWENTRAATLEGLSRALVRLHRHGEAAAVYRDWLRLEPVKLAAWNGLALALGEQREWKEAEFAAKRVLDLSIANTSAKPDRLAAWCTLGRILMRQQGRTEEARRAFREALRIEPDNPEARSAIEALGESNPADPEAQQE